MLRIPCESLNLLTKLIYSHTLGVRARRPLILQSIFVLRSFFLLLRLLQNPCSRIINLHKMIRFLGETMNLLTKSIYSHTLGVRARKPLILQSTFVILSSFFLLSSLASKSLLTNHEFVFKCLDFFVKPRSCLRN